MGRKTVHIFWAARFFAGSLPVLAKRVDLSANSNTASRFWKLCISAERFSPGRPESRGWIFRSVRDPNARMKRKAPKALADQGFRRCFLASPGGFEPPAFRLGEPANHINGLTQVAKLYAAYKAVQRFSCKALQPTFSRKPAVFFATDGTLFALQRNADARLSFRFMPFRTCATVR